MGHRIMKLANGPLYRNVSDSDFRVLMFLAQIVLDNDRDDTPSATWFGGIEPIVMHRYGITPDAPEYRARYSTIQKIMSRLDKLGAIRRTRHGVGGARSQYEICPLQGTLTGTLFDPILSTPPGAKDDPPLAPPQVHSVHPPRCTVSTPPGALLAPPQVLTSKDSTKETTVGTHVRASSLLPTDLARTGTHARQATR
jgi:hypothetical protein